MQFNNYWNGQTISERHWDDQWIQDIQSSRYLENGDLEQMSISVSPDCGTVTNHVSLMDFLGRSVCIVTPLGTTTNIYDGATSRLISTTRFTPTTSSTSTYLYDDMGTQVGQSQNGITSLSDTIYESISNEWWRVSKQYTFCNGVTNSFSVSREQLTGLSNALRRRSFSTSPDGVTMHAFASFNPSTGILTETTESDTHFQVIRRKKFGRVVETESSNGRFYNYFDPYGRTFLTRRPLPGDSGRKATR